MGRKTKSPEATREEISDLLVEQTVQHCPLLRKGDIRIIVAWRHDLKPVAGVPVTLSGPPPGAGVTEARSKALFAKTRDKAVIEHVETTGGDGEDEPLHEFARMS